MPHPKLLPVALPVPKRAKVGRPSKYTPEERKERAREQNRKYSAKNRHEFKAVYAEKWGGPRFMHEGEGTEYLDTLHVELPAPMTLEDVESRERWEYEEAARLGANRRGRAKLARWGKQ